MRSVLVAIAIILALGSTAIASSKRVSPDQVKVLDSKAMVVESDSYDVYVGGRLIGRDPDPAVRAQLRNDHYLRNGH